jgi:hypothetical protein
VQFVVLSDVNASDFTTRVSVPIFRDPTSNRGAWQETQPGATKHDTFVYARDGARVLFWDASNEELASFSSKVRAAVEAQGK